MFEAIILGIVQGLTEFIPVSSSAHLVLVPWLFNWNTELTKSVQFDVALHLGTLLAVLIYFRREWYILVTAGLRAVTQRRFDGPDVPHEESHNRRLFWYLLLATIPAGLIGLLLETRIDDFFHPTKEVVSTPALIIMAGGLIIMATVLLIVERYFASRKRDFAEVGFKDTILIGLAQALALVPGVSRSGSTITAGLALGFKRDVATRFSFLLSTPITLAVGLKGIYDLAKAGLNGDQWLTVLVGFVVSGLVGYACIAFLLAYLRRRSTLVFVLYRYAFASLILIVLFTRL